LFEKKKKRNKSESCEENLLDVTPVCLPKDQKHQANKKTSVLLFFISDLTDHFRHP